MYKRKDQVIRYVNILLVIYYSFTQIDIYQLIVMKLPLYGMGNLFFYFLGRYS